MRVDLRGVGTPTPTEALPIAPGSDLPPLSLMLSNGVPFLKASHISAGYTHYEVWCIGAVGGNGGGAFVPVGVHNDNYTYGGAGGGGGLHRVLGELAGLPVSVPVVVGIAGVNGAQGSNKMPKTYDDPSGLWVPTPGYVAPLAGSDGEKSSFNDMTCVASGGKGGGPYLHENQPTQPPRSTSLGGVGGSGGQAAAGGGAVGGRVDVTWVPSYGGYNYVPVTPADGPWDGIVGKGGGGGNGGYWIFPGFTNQAPFILNESSSGGQGSFSYDDTSVFGARQPRANFTPTFFYPFTMTVLPGAGGGAKLPTGQVFGSYSPGASPNGAVFIRLSKLV